MTRAITIAARELRERSFVFVTAAIIALVPFIAAVLRSANTAPLPVIAVAGFAMSLIFTLGLAGVLGASMVGRELSERRLSFYFSRPVSPSAIWIGKLGGAVVTIAISFTLIFLPSYVVAHAVWAGTLWQMTAAGYAGLVLIASVYLLLVMHALSSMVRSRSALVALDLSLLALFAGAMWLVVRPLLVNLAMGVVARVIGLVAAAIPVAIAAAGAWQLSRGRTDIRRSHRELSRFFWICMAVIVAVAAAYVAWVLSATPQDLRDVKVAANNSADWMAMTGVAKNRGDYAPSFLVDTRTGKSKHFAGARWRSPEFTRRGDAAISIGPSAESIRSARGELYVQRIASPDANPATGIETSIFARVVLSDDLRRVAIYDAHLLSVYDLESHALLASVRIPAGDDAQMFFVSPSVVRLYVLSTYKIRGSIVPSDVPIFEFAIENRRLEEIGRLPASAFYRITTSRDGSTLVVVRVPEGKIVFNDGRTGAVRATIDVPKGRFRWIELLSNGGIAFVDSTRVRWFDGKGQLVRDVSLGGGVFGGHVRELVPDRKWLVVIRRAYVANAAIGSDLAIVDLERGVVERVDRNLAIREQFWPADPRVPDATTEFVVSDAKGTLWRWNALTGEKRKIFG
ncbi:MAG TPA: ABC transporter permease [Thermoanaerobaculia bacterium]|nr:ABC transporter permease [Thermoanaerobaculia bacterium]